MGLADTLLGGYALLGLSYKTAPLEVMKSLHYPDVREGVRQLHHQVGAGELVLLQTCHRIEVYLYSTNPLAALNRLVELFGVRAPDLDMSHLRQLRGEEVVSHLFRVAAGLDSMMLGEHEVLGQVGEALALAQRVGAARRFLTLLFTKAMAVGKRVRVETGISRGPVSLAHAAVDLASREVRLSAVEVVVLGAGRTGRRVAKYLHDHGARSVTILNRTLEKAEMVAHRYQYRAAPLSELRNHLAKADLAFIATGAPYYLVTEKTLSERRKPLFLVDLSSPSNVEPGVAHLPQVRVIGLEGLKEIAEANRRRRARAAVKAAAIVQREVAAFREEVRREYVREVLGTVLLRAESIRQEEVAKAVKALGWNGREEVLEAFSRSLVQKVLSPLITAAHHAADRNDLATLGLIVKLFEEGW